MKTLYYSIIVISVTLVLILPSAAFATMLYNNDEVYGKHTSNEFEGIPIPTQYGPHQAVNSTTILSNHVRPQAGITLYHDKVKLLVSK